MTGEAPTDDRSPPVVLAGGTPLIFDWRPVRWRKTRLMVALVVAAAGHLLVFYLFQVVTGSSPRQAPPIRQALILPGSEASTRRLLEGMEDRLPSLHAASPMEETGAEFLAGLVKGYVPTWQDHRPALKPLPGQGGGGPLPPLTAAPALLLPPLPPADNAPPAARETGPAGRPMPVLSFQSGLALRKILTPPVWPAAVTAEDWPEEGPASFLMSVSPAGDVTSCLSLGASAGLDEEMLRRVLMKLRFAPATGSDEPEWGWVDVLW